MPEVPPPAEKRNPLVTIVQPRERPERPPPCGGCSGRSWWNGWRVVFPVVATAVARVLERWELALARAKCSACRRSFTCYPPGIYPRRRCQLDVVAQVTADLSLGGQTAAWAAAGAHASVRSAHRWTRWVADLGKPAELLALAAQFDPDAPAGAGLSVAAAAGPGVRSRAARVLAALEHLGAALLRHGHASGAQTGLGRVLSWQHAAHADVYGLVAGVRSLSPAMAAGGAVAGV